MPSSDRALERCPSSEVFRPPSETRYQFEIESIEPQSRRRCKSYRHVVAAGASMRALRLEVAALRRPPKYGSPHRPHEFLKQIETVLRARARLGMVLHAER